MTENPLTERQSLRMTIFNAPVVLYPPTGNRTEWQRAAISSGHSNDYASACGWDQTKSSVFLDECITHMTTVHLSYLDFVCSFE